MPKGVNTIYVNATVKQTIPTLKNTNTVLKLKKLNN